MSKTTWRIALLAANVVAVAGLGFVLLRDDGASLRSEWTTCTAPRVLETPPVAPEPVVLDLDAVEVGDADQPTAMADTGDGLLVSSLTGTISDLRTGELVLDLTPQVLVGPEQGLLDIEAAPDGGWLYVSYTERPDGRSRVRAWPLDGSLPFDPAGGVEILSLEQPHRWHNGGGIGFGPDGNLYVAFGDGGAEEEAEGSMRAQDLSNWYGALLRISPTPEAGGGYGVPPDNPFVGRQGAAPEILHYGFRNPWRFSFDETGALWIADVGHWCVEEIDRVEARRAGENFGWPGLEGSYEWAFPEADGTVPPVYEYIHTSRSGEKNQCSVSGGEVYQGISMPKLRGVYVYTDFCEGLIRGIRLEGGEVTEYELGVEVPNPVGVVSDAEGQLYVMAMGEAGGVYRLG